MNETHSPHMSREIATKTLAIIGFVVTVALVVWLIFLGIKHLPQGFSSLASLLEGLERHRTSKEITLATEKSVVNSGESFQISWTNMKRDGEYRFSFNCQDGVELLVRSVEGSLIPVRCTDTLSLPKEVDGLFLSINSDVMRFTDVMLKIEFVHTDRTKLGSETKITVVNATIPVTEPEPEVVISPEPEIKPEPKPEPAPEPKPVPKPQAPIITQVVPESNPNGYVDLAVTTVGSGMLINGDFVTTPTYDTDGENAIRFDIKNIGTKASGSWTFKTILPSGDVFESREQASLHPQEHVVFTLGFRVDDDSEGLAKITNTVRASNDINAHNNSSVWYVVVRD